jgi:hypothetical protein
MRACEHGFVAGESFPQGYAGGWLLPVFCKFLPAKNFGPARGRRVLRMIAFAVEKSLQRSLKQRASINRQSTQLRRVCSHP